ncbi:MAG: hypothetical protein AB1598_03935 [Thermodesulfobacteriota bacterium]
MNFTLRIIWIAILPLYITACAPKIVSFQASPGRLCKGQNTVVSWSVVGGALLLATPLTSGTGVVPSSGSKSFTPLKPTKFTIIAMRSGKDVFAEQEVVVVESGNTQSLVIETQPDGAHGLIAKETLKPQIWDDMMRIDTISGQSNRALRVFHEGHEIILPADGTPSDQMRGAKISGLWEIRANLLSGEVMGDPTHAPPDRLRVLVNLTCRSQGGTM